MMKAQDLWVWTKRVPRDEEGEWEDRLAGEENVVITEDVHHSRAVVSAYSVTEAGAVALRERFGGTVGLVEDKDWVAESARPEPPVVVRGVLVVTQETGEEALGELSVRYPGRRVLSVPAQMAFGTGQHATTSSCLRMLADIGKGRKPGWSMVDIGTGSGLLALAGRIFGAAAGAVDAFDYDAKAVEVAEENAGRNGVEGVRFFEADVLGWEPVRRYDVVVANLYSGLLEKAMPEMRAAASVGADLVLSGILRAQLEDVLKAARLAGFRIVRSVVRGKWAAVRGAAG